MSRSRLFLLILSLVFAGSGCLTGAGTSGIGPGAGGVLPTPSSIIGDKGDKGDGGATASGTTPGTPTGAGTPRSAAAAEGGDDTMPPRADANDCLSHHLDGTVYCGPPIREACRISYVPGPKIKVLPGYAPPLPPILQDGTTPMNGHFYAETGSAPMACADASCWTWQPAGVGDYVRMRLSRLQPSAPMLEFYQDAAVSLLTSDESNVAFSGVPAQNADQIDFFYTFSDTVPYGNAPALASLTDDVWTHFGVKCEMGGFQIETPTVYEKSDIPSPARDLLGRPDFLLVR
jgi:hypothetical protein